jgi:pantoate--beta-alanine ligase
MTKIIKSGAVIQDLINEIKEAGKTVGFVPTMGALHDGHLSLIKIAKENSDFAVCSIFINPTQFNDPKDFEKYPKNIAEDLKLLENSGCDIVFVPDIHEIYPNGFDQIDYNIGALSKVMEGKFRKGHFNGVVQVVKRFFEIVKPNVAVFGNKDFQQLAVINWMVNYFNLNIEIIGAPIIREPDGLAMSSRNKRLSRSERKTAINIYKTLLYISNNYKNMGVYELKSRAKDQLDKIENLELEYLEIADTTTLQPVSEIDYEYSTAVFIAARTGQIRLIDNVVLF